MMRWYVVRAPEAVKPINTEYVRVPAGCNRIYRAPVPSNMSCCMSAPCNVCNVIQAFTESAHA
jgi:hypothetical protein